MSTTTVRVWRRGAVTTPQHTSAHDGVAVRPDARDHTDCPVTSAWGFDGGIVSDSGDAADDDATGSGCAGEGRRVCDVQQKKEKKEMRE